MLKHELMATGMWSGYLKFVLLRIPLVEVPLLQTSTRLLFTQTKLRQVSQINLICPVSISKPSYRKATRQQLHSKEHCHDATCCHSDGLSLCSSHDAIRTLFRSHRLWRFIQLRLRPHRPEQQCIRRSLRIYLVHANLLQSIDSRISRCIRL